LRRKLGYSFTENNLLVGISQVDFEDFLKRRKKETTAAAKDQAKLISRCDSNF
jgi:hypothetical protein